MKTAEKLAKELIFVARNDGAQEDFDDCYCIFDAIEGGGRSITEPNAVIGYDEFCELINTNIPKECFIEYVDDLKKSLISLIKEVVEREEQISYEETMRRMLLFNCFEEVRDHFTGRYALCNKVYCAIEKTDTIEGSKEVASLIDSLL